MRLLHLTNLRYKNRNIKKNDFFLGNWCLNITENYKYKDNIIPYHWENLKKQSKDYFYLEKLHKRISNSLYSFLNSFHNIKYTNKSWGVINEPFLQYYVTVLYDRWEILKKTFKTNKKFQINFYEIKNIDFNNLDNFINLVLSDEWNEYIFQSIINYNYKKKIKVNHKFNEFRYSKSKKTNNETVTYNFKNNFFEICNKVFNIITKKNSFVFFEHYFDRKNFILLNMKLSQIPYFLNPFKKLDKDFQNYSKKNFSIREKLFNNVKLNNDFEKFLILNLKKDLPTFIIEDFNQIQKNIDKIDLKPKFIFSGGLHWSNQHFKHWLAKKMSKGTKFISLEHGGSFPYKHPYFFFEEKNSDKFITWFSKYHKNQKQLPAQKLFGYNSLDKFNYQPVHCNLIIDRFMRYTLDLAQPVSGNYYEFINDLIFFNKKLNFKIQKYLKIKTHPADKDKLWNTKKFLKKKINKNVLIENKNLQEVFLDSKLLICFYPETTFAESMKLGIPTILYVSPKIYKIHQISKNLYKKLKDANLLFDDIDLLTKHINNIWDNPLIWWNSEKSVKKRKLFEKVALGIDKKDSFDKWKNYLFKLKSQND